MTLHRHGRLALGFIILLCPNLAFAIPSPELIIGSAASVSQLFGMGAALLGGGALLARGRMKSAATHRAIRRLQIGILLTACVAVLLAGLSIYQWQSAKQNRLAHLQATLQRPAVINDPTLKELSFNAQTQNQLGISTDAAFDLLTMDTNTIFVDVREGAEHVMGTIPSAHHIRFPDVDVTDPIFQGKRVVLLCHNGNRSSETCAKLAALGIDCNFIQGGIEKWLVEGRPFSDNDVRGLADLRAIPAYDNKDMLLDTSQISDLMATDPPVFIDVRYPGDFATGHLPDAVNIPVRATPTDQLMEQLTSLPDRPIVAACYDRRGCFISQVLGYELAKLGYDFRGRYTVPWEYFVPPEPKPHVADFIAKANRSLWQKSIDAVAAVLIALSKSAPFLLVVAGLAVVTRILVLPVALKSERDQMIIRQNQIDLSTIKTTYKGDPAGKSAALQTFYKRHGITPMRNALALLFLPVTMIGISAVEAASLGQAGVLWFANAGVADPLFILPTLAGVLGGAYLWVSFGSTPKRKAVGFVLGGGIVAGLSIALSAAASYYLICALALLFLQRAFVSGAIPRIWHGFLQRLAVLVSSRVQAGTIPLGSRHVAPNMGNKAYRLSVMAHAGIPVPKGFVIPQETLSKLDKGSHATNKIIRFANRKFGTDLLAVRSSASAEDGDAQSFAGVFESVLYVLPKEIDTAIREVTRSFKAEHTLTYADGGDENVLVQQMVDADYAGVLFTQNPMQPSQGLIEWVNGTAEDLVSGRVTPSTCITGRLSRKFLDGDAPIDLAPLLSLGQKIETLFGRPQDVEWVYKNGHFMIVQARDITTLDANVDDATAAEWDALTTRFETETRGQPLLVMDDMSEVLPRPTPLSLSYMQRLWGWGGSVHLACEELGLTYNVPQNARPHLTTVFGRLYADTVLKQRTQVSVTKRALRKFHADPREIERQYRDSELPAMEHRVSVLKTMDYGNISLPDLRRHVANLFNEFITDIHVPVEKINIAAHFFNQNARQLAVANSSNFNKVYQGSSEVTPFGLIAFSKPKTQGDKRQILMKEFGHRSPYDYELTEPRYAASDVMMQILLTAAEVPDPKPIRQEFDHLSADMQDAMKHAAAYQTLKDVAKHNSLKFLAEIKRAVDALDTACGFKGDLHFATLEEIEDLDIDLYGRSEQWARRRRHRADLLECAALPVSLTLAEFEKSTLKSKSAAGGADGWQGQSVSGNRTATGRVVRMTAQEAETGAPIANFQAGDVLACPFVHPSWLPYVTKAGAVLTEVGGWLSHMAIIAREHRVPMVVGVAGLMHLSTDDWVFVSPDGVIERIDAPERLRQNPDAKSA